MALRNAGVAGASAVTLGLLLLYPTSTNNGGTPRRPGQALAPAGVVQPAPDAGTSGGSTAASSSVVNGTSVDTPYGPVQVQITISGGKIVGATTIDYPQNNGRDRAINSHAIPVLQQETAAAQSAQVDTVSGATFTSNGYRQSLQAALDAAHLK